jgi:hypothetical protein
MSNNKQNHQPHKGWANQVTWQVWVWVTNTQDIYERLLESMALSDGLNKATAVKMFVEQELYDHMPEVHVVAELVAHAIDDVDWLAIATELGLNTTIVNDALAPPMV